MKTYTAVQAAELQGIGYHALRKRLDRDSKVAKKLRKYPHAYKTECCGSWVLPEKDLKK